MNIYNISDDGQCSGGKSKHGDDNVGFSGAEELVIFFSFSMLWNNLYSISTLWF